MLDQVRWKNDWPFVVGGSPSLKSRETFFLILDFIFNRFVIFLTRKTCKFVNG